MTTAFELLQSETIFTKLYLQNTLCIHKTAFNTPTSYYKYQVMPFRLVNSRDKTLLSNSSKVLCIFTDDPFETSTIAEPFYCRTTYF